MKKILLVLLSLLLLCSCGNNSEVAEEKTEETAPVETVTDVISNNSPYDEGEDSEPDFSNLLYSENGIEIYGRDNLTYVSPADAQMTISLLIKNNNDFTVEMDHGSAYDVTIDNFTGSITNYCQDFTAGLHPNGADYQIEANSEMRLVFDISVPNFNNQNESLEGDLAFHFDFRFFDVSDEAEQKTVAEI